MELTAKPCPFCGGTIDVENESYFKEVDGPKWGAVQCGCGGQGPEIRTGYNYWEAWRESALKEWNKRA